MKKAIIYIVVIISAIGTFAFILKSNKENNAEQTRLASVTNEFIPVEMYTAQNQNLATSFKSTGNFQAISELDFASEVSGRIVTIQVKEGDRVSKGQLLARIDDKYLQNELATAKANFEQAKVNKERFDQLIKTGGITQTQFEDVTLNYQNTKTRLENVQLRLQDTYIKAPISGIINNKYIETGSYITPGTKLFNIVETESLELVVNVTESQALEVKEGEKVKVVADAIPNQSIDGKVTYVGVKADKSLSYPVKIAINNDSDPAIKAGMFGTATFEKGQTATVLAIPRAAIIGSLQSPQVYVITDQKAILTDITIGKTDGNTVEITSGLNPGEQVIISGQINLENGSKVSIIND